MAEYKVIYRDENPAWQPGCPLIIETVQVSRNTDTSQCYLQLKARNIGIAAIGKVTLSATVSTPTGTSEQATIESLDADIPAGKEWKPRAVALSAREVSSVQVCVCAIDGVLIATPLSPKPVQKDLVLTSELSTVRAGEMAKANVDPSKLTREVVIGGAGESWWICSCGQMNVGAEACISCRTSVNKLLEWNNEIWLAEKLEEQRAALYDAAERLSQSDSVDMLYSALTKFKSLSAIGYRDAEERCLALRGKIAEVESVYAKKRKKATIIGSIIAAVVAIAVALLFLVVLPAIDLHKAQNPNTDPAVLTELAKSDRQAVREAVFQNDSTPEDAKWLYLTDLFSEEERLSVVRDPDCQVDVLRRLANDEDPDVRGCIAWNPNTPEDILRVLAGDEDPDVRQFVAGRRGCPEELMQILADDPNPLVRQSVANNPDCPWIVLLHLVDDENNAVRLYVAMNSNSDDLILGFLADDSEYVIRLMVSAHPNCPEKTRKRIDQYLAEDVGAGPFLKATDFSCSADTLRGLAGIKDWSLTVALCLNPNCPADVLLKLSETEDEFVLFSLTLNPNCSEDVLRKLADNNWTSVRRNVAEHPNCPADVLSALSEDGHVEVREAAMANPNCPRTSTRLRPKNQGTEVADLAGDSPETPQTPTPMKPSWLKSVAVGDIVTLGNYEQDNDLGNGPEAIEWKVIAVKGDGILLLSVCGLDMQPYNDAWDNDWETSDLKTWLEETFADEAGLTEYANGLTCLSLEEYKEYLQGTGDVFCRATPYAIAHGTYIDGKGCCYWWLRSPSVRTYVYRISWDGIIVNAGLHADNKVSAVRPALWIAF